MHAESNAVTEAGRKNTNNGTIYATMFPCLGCAKVLVQAGIKRIVYNRDYDMPISKKFLESCKGIEVVQVTPH